VCLRSKRFTSTTTSNSATCDALTSGSIISREHCSSTRVAQWVSTLPAAYARDQIDGPVTIKGGFSEDREEAFSASGLLTPGEWADGALRAVAFELITL